MNLFKSVQGFSFVLSSVQLYRISRQKNVQGFSCIIICTAVQDLSSKNVQGFSFTLWSVKRMAQIQY